MHDHSPIADGTTGRRTRRLALAATAATLLAVPWLAGHADASTRGAGVIGTRTPAAGTSTCRGEPAVLVTDGEWHGTAERDVVVVTGASTSIWASSGDDVICVHNAGYHGSTINAGPGDDVVITFGGMNDVYGGFGADVIIGNGEGELLEGEEDDDILKTSGPSYLDGGDGNDRLTGSGDGDTLRGEEGNDLLLGFGGDDHLEGGAGFDELRGGAGFDDLDGGTDPDTCLDGPGIVDGASYSSCDSIVVTPNGGIDQYAG